MDGTATTTTPTTNNNNNNNININNNSSSNSCIRPSSRLTSSSLDRVTASGNSMTSGPVEVSSVRHRHSAPPSFNAANHQSQASQANAHSHHHHSHHHHHQSQSLVEWFRYLVLFLFAYLKVLLVRFVPPLALFLSYFIDFESVRNSESQEQQSQQTPPPKPTRKISQSHQLPSPSRALAQETCPNNCTNTANRSLVNSQTPISSNCVRACCRSLSMSGPSSDQQYSSIDDLVQNKYKSQQKSNLRFPFSVIPLSLINFFLPVKPFNMNFLDNVPRIGRYYKTLTEMRGRLTNIFRWRQTSANELDNAEKKVLSLLKTPYKTYYVDIGKGWDLESVLIWTLEMAPKKHQINKVDQNSSQMNSTPNRNGTDSNQFVPLQLQGLPLVLVHGFASGIGLWTLNLDELSMHGKRHLFAFDLLGFAKSSRPKFTFSKFHGLTQLQQAKAEAEAMEEYLVDSIEKWRREIGTPLEDKFIILGHAFGAYLATAYALRYPDRVAHLILVDPWGFPPDSHRTVNNNNITAWRHLPFWLQFASRVILDHIPPLTGLRAAGPWGPAIISALRPDLKKKFQRLADEAVKNRKNAEAGNDADISSSSSDEEKAPKKEEPPNDNVIVDYIYQCNAQAQPSGEEAFKKLSTATRWARMPLLERIIELESHITLSFIYGSRSWVDRQSGYQAKYILATAANSFNAMALRSNPNSSSDDDEPDPERVNVHIIQGAGHHLYADKPDEFNDLVNNICTEIDLQMLHAAMEESGNEFEWMDDDDGGSLSSYLQPQFSGWRPSSGDFETIGNTDASLFNGADGNAGVSSAVSNWPNDETATFNATNTTNDQSNLTTFKASTSLGSSTTKLDYVPEEDSS